MPRDLLGGIVTASGETERALREQVATLTERVRQLEQLVQVERDGALSLDDRGSAILQKRFLHRVDGAGYLEVPQRCRRFAMDVGFNIGNIMIGDWLLTKRTGLETFMIGVEANPYLHTLFSEIITEQPWPDVTSDAARERLASYTHCPDNVRVEVAHGQLRQYR